MSCDEYKWMGEQMNFEIYIYIYSSYKNRKQLMTLPCVLLISQLYFLLFLFVPVSRHTLDVLLTLPYRGSARLGRRLEMR